MGQPQHLYAQDVGMKVVFANGAYSASCNGFCKQRMTSLHSVMEHGRQRYLEVSNSFGLTIREFALRAAC